LHRVSPDSAPRLAAGSVDFVQKKFGFSLPYTPESLLVVDAIVDKIRETGATEQQASGLLVGLGCYAGEVLVRHARASWRWTKEMGMVRTCLYPVVLALRGAQGCDPIGRVFLRFGTGVSESVAALYDNALAQPTGEPSRDAKPSSADARSGVPTPVLKATHR